MGLTEFGFHVRMREEGLKKKKKKRQIRVGRRQNICFSLSDLTFTQHDGL